MVNTYSTLIIYSRSVHLLCSDFTIFIWACVHLCADTRLFIDELSTETPVTQSSSMVEELLAAVRLVLSESLVRQVGACFQFHISISTGQTRSYYVDLTQSNYRHFVVYIYCHMNDIIHYITRRFKMINWSKCRCVLVYLVYLE